MKAIIIDDDQLSIRYLENVLTEIGGLEIIGSYRDPLEALDVVVQLEPDIIFLDIVLPRLNGIEAGKRFQVCLPQVQIVFITAHNHYAYAVKAFEVDALDFIIKPFQPQRLLQTIQKLKNKNQHLSSMEVGASILMIRCFKSLQIDRLESRPYTLPLRWRTAKAQELFAYLVYRHGEPIRKELLLELFWPQTEPSKASAHLYTIIYQIRQSLHAAGVKISIMNHGGGYSLDLQGIRIDVEEWERCLQRAISTQFLDSSTLDKLMELYRGDYLADYDYPWAASERERLRTLWIESVTKVADQLIAKAKYLEALKLYQYQQQLHPYLEESYLKLMQLYAILGDHQAVEQQYRSLQTMLSQEFNLGLQSAVRSWYQHWKKFKNVGEA